MNRFQIIKCNPNIYKGLLLKWQGTSNKVYNYQVNPALFIKRDSLLLFYIKQTNSIRIVNKLGTSSMIKDISLSQFDSLSIQFIPVNDFALKRQLILTYDFVNKCTINLFATAVKRITKRKDFVNSIDSLPQSVPINKSYWQKHSDMSRNNYVRLMRYLELVGISSDSRLKRGFATKFITMKYLCWKLQLSSTKVFKQFSSHFVSTQLINSLVNWLVVLGYYSTYLTASQSIKAGNVVINGQVITNRFYQLQLNDLIAIKPCEWVKLENNWTSELYDFANVNLSSCNILVIKLLNFNLMQSVLLNPMNNIFTRSNNIINRISK